MKTLLVEWKSTFLKKMKKYKTLYYNIKLCVKYPFLYPRNRFSGNHYDNHKLAQIVWNIQRKNHDTIILHFYRQGEEKIINSTEVYDLNINQFAEVTLKNEKNVRMFFTIGKHFCVSEGTKIYVDESLDKYTYGKKITEIKCYKTKTFGGYYNFNFNITIDDDNREHKNYPNTHIIGLDTTPTKDKIKLQIYNFLNRIL